MNVLFTSQMVGNVEIKNRFIHSATYEGWQILTVELLLSDTFL